MSESVNWPAFATRVARVLLGKPTFRTQTEIGFDSLSVQLDRGIWFDHETKEGGGMAALVARERCCSTGEALDRLRKGGFVCPAYEYENAVEWFRRRQEEYKGLSVLLCAHFGHSETNPDMDVIMFPHAEGNGLCFRFGHPETLVIMNAIMFPHAEGWDFREPVVKAIVDGFEREIAKGSETLYLLHDGEAEARKVGSWDRYIAYRALKCFVEVASERSEFVDRDGEWRDLLHRAEAILGKRTVNHPRGKGNPRQSCARDFFIVSCLNEILAQFPDCVLKVTSSKPRASLAAAMAEATRFPERTIRSAWENTPSWFRPKRPRKRFADVPCAQCGCLKVPAWRARRDDNPLCKQCSPALEF